MNRPKHKLWWQDLPRNHKELWSTELVNNPG
jgi:hypothetical protein